MLSRSYWSENYTWCLLKNSLGFDTKWSYYYFSSHLKNGKSRVIMLTRRIASAQISIFEKSSIIGSVSLLNCSGAMNYFVPDKKPLRISGLFSKSSWYNEVE